tara:strand:- start:482 stop:775 length:294 start_codon:yes stop_codon:yes gene_type:complete
MNYDHDATRKAYPNAETIIDNAGVFDKDSKVVSLDQAKIDTARKELDDAAALIKYKSDRAAEYPSYGEQLDYIFHHGLAKWKTDIVQPVKDKFPKPL